MLQLQKKAITLFSGAGGNTRGLTNAGYNVVAFSETKKDAIATHLKEFPNCRLLTSSETASTDISKIPDKVFEYYTHSIEIIFANLQSHDFIHNQCVRVVGIIKPKYIIGETLPNILCKKAKDANTGKQRLIIESLNDLFNSIGYNIIYKVIQVNDLGIPQKRKRLIIIGTRDIYPRFSWNSLTDNITNKNVALRSIIQLHLDGAIEYSEDRIPDGLSPHYWIVTPCTKSSGKPHTKLVKLQNNIHAASSSVVYCRDLSKPPNRGGGSGARLYILDPDAPCKTIPYTYSYNPCLFVGFHNPDEGKYWIRCLSIEELGRIQGFPPNYQWQGNEKQIISQIASAMPPFICESIAKNLERA